MKFWWVLLVALVAGCASRPFDAHLDAPSEPVRACAQWYQALDRAVDEEGVRDAQYTRVAGFPYLRVNRLFASLRPRAAASDAAFQAFIERLGELDLEARAHEVLNLPRSRVEALPEVGPTATRDLVLRRTQDCGRLLRELDLARPHARAVLLEAAEAPDDYSLAARALGLYPLTRIAFAAGIRRWEARTRERFAQPGEPSLAVRFAPPPAAPLARVEVAQWLARAHADPLGMPLLSERELAALALRHAPSFEVDLVGDYDRFGALRWRRDATTPEVDASQLAAYVHPAYTRYGEQVLLQLVYTIWFPERPPRGALDVLAGRLDGVTWRVTLAPDGEPLLYDSIHPCGCYHLFFPTPRARPRAAPDPLDEWAFAPQSLPRVQEGERPLVRLASATHYIAAVSLVQGTDSLSRYELRSYEELRSLPRPDGARRSAFGDDGLIAGSERLERFLFWPMGIASAGAMRQWGRHATAFVGRRHFDDAHLVERRFELEGVRP